MKLLAIDPALRNTGLVTCDYHPQLGIEVATIQTVITERDAKVAKSIDDLRCAHIISAAIERTIAVHEPVVVVSEIPHGAQSSRAGWALGIVVGLLAGIKHPLIVVSPTEVKRRFTGSAKAQKPDMVEHAVKRFPTLKWHRNKQGVVSVRKNEHMADAIAVAFAATFEDRFLEIYADWVVNNQQARADRVA